MATEDEVNDQHCEPSLPEQTIPHLEKEEDVLFQMRAKLFRWAREAEPAEWKERGTGDVKLLKHKTTLKIRLLMRRDKTFKICANHYITKQMELIPHCGSDRAWIWTTFADFCDDKSTEELLAIRFLNSENASKFQAKFKDCQNMVSTVGEKAEMSIKKTSPSEEEQEKQKESEEKEVKVEAKEEDKIVEKLEELTVKGDEGSSKENTEEVTKKTEVEDSPEK